MAGLASEVRTQEEQPTVRRIPSGANLAKGIVGVFERGEIGEALGPFADMTELTKECGGYTANNLETMAACQGFFDNGGTELWVARAVHCTTPGNPGSRTSAKGSITLQTPDLVASAGSVLSTNSAPFNLTPGDTLLVKVDGAGALTATFDAAAAAVESASGPFDLADNDTLTVKIDGGSAQTITIDDSAVVSIDAVTAAELAAIINGQLVGGSAAVTNTNKVTIYSDKEGTDSHVEVTGGTANGTVGFSTSEADGTGDVADINAVTAAEVITVVEADVATATVTSESGRIRIATGTNGSGGKVQVTSSSTADDEFGFDNAEHLGSDAGAVDTLQIDGKTDGAYTDEVTPIVSAATNGEDDHFDIAFARNGIVSATERFRNVNMDPDSANYVVTRVNDPLLGSDLVSVTDLEAAVDNAVPDTGTFGPLEGGDDGLTSLGNNDFIGAATVDGDTGLRVFDAVDLDVLTVPQMATAAVHNAMITYVEITRAGLCFAVLDPPAGFTAIQMVEYVKTTASLFNLSEYAAIYWPRIRVTNPNKSIYGNDELVTVPPSGHVVGVYARVDASKIGGVSTHPAGTDAKFLPRNVRGLETAEVKKKSKRELVFPALINPISQEKGTSIFIDGARTLKEDGNWPTIGQRRGVIFLEKRLVPGLAFMRHRNIRPRLYKEGERTVQVFFLELTANEFFASDVPSEAWTIDFGPGLNKASTRKARTVVARVNVAMAEPAEFVLLLVGPDTRALDAELAALAA